MKTGLADVKHPVFLLFDAGGGLWYIAPFLFGIRSHNS
jgi:hypothetical protein